ncbi:MAG TPA: ABC transporter permease, partial [Gammaproteobacteria bacterium]|nr:ABC transporter permease [Gammaproteobacteria bacterium]
MGRFRESDFLYDFQRSPVTVVSFVIVVMLILLAVFADLVAPTNPFDAGSLNL